MPLKKENALTKHGVITIKSPLSASTRLFLGIYNDTIKISCILTISCPSSCGLHVQKIPPLLLGRTKMTRIVDELYATMNVKLKALLQQSTSVSLTTDGRKTPTGDSVCGHHWSLDKFRMRTFVSHIRCEHQQCFTHSTGDCDALKWDGGKVHRLDLQPVDNGANFVAAAEQLLENEIEQVRCACHSL